MKLLEICCFNLASVLLAQKMGAQRIELCADASGGGTTPSWGLIELARKKLEIPLYPIIRPREGDFLYTEEEFEIMLQDTMQCRRLGCDGVVIGILQKNGTVDKERCIRLVEAAYPMGVTFHRAFDWTYQPFDALEDIISLGCERILTSGQKQNAKESTGLIAELISRADQRIIIMPGAGIRGSNISEIANQTRADEFHSSARMTMHSHMQFIQPSMEETPGYPMPDSGEIKTMLTALRALD
ncbi:MAG: copper homeostasis protein CutC [Chitinophagales bacterium]